MYMYLLASFFLPSFISLTCIHTFILLIIIIIIMLNYYVHACMHAYDILHNSYNYYCTEQHTHTHIHIYMYIHTHVHNIVQICQISRRRGRENERSMVVPTPLNFYWKR